MQAACIRDKYNIPAYLRSFIHEFFQLERDVDSLMRAAFEFFYMLIWRMELLIGQCYVIIISGYQIHVL